MTPTEWAAKLNGREIGEEVTNTEAALAKADGVVIVFGASDDLIEFRGAIDDEGGCNDGGTIRVDAEGILEEWEDADGYSEQAAEEYFRRKSKVKNITAIWSPSNETTGVAWASWAYETFIPHVTFEIMEDGELYCQGIVFALSDLA